MELWQSGATNTRGCSKGVGGMGGRLTIHEIMYTIQGLHPGLNESAASLSNKAVLLVCHPVRSVALPP